MALFRPSSFKEFIGNENIKERLNIQISVHKEEKTALSHIMFAGPAGVGKTTLAQIVGYKFGAELIRMTGGSMKSTEGMIILLRQIGKLQIKKKKVVLFIDEVHDLSKSRILESAWLPLFEEFVFFHNMSGNIFVDPKTGEEFEARRNEIKVNPFTIIGATTNAERLSKPLRDRFLMSCEMEEYDTHEMELIVAQYIKKRKFSISKPVINKIATRSRFNPRTTTSLGESCIIRAKSYKSNIITQEIFNDECKAQKIDNLGLGVIDRKALTILSDVYPRGMGVNRLSGQLLMKPNAFCELYEGYLERINLVVACTKGRKITDIGLNHLKNFTF